MLPCASEIRFFHRPALNNVDGGGKRAETAVVCLLLTLPRGSRST
jgi:hypothetical protein